MRIALLPLLVLAACSSEPPVENQVVPVTNVQTPTAPTTRLPDTLVGRWAVTPDQCRRGAAMGITVEPSAIRFYESVATITDVTPLPDGTFGIDADVTGEGQTEARSFDLKLLDGGKRLLRVEAPIPDITYTRCESET